MASSSKNSPTGSCFAQAAGTVVPTHQPNTERVAAPGSTSPHPRPFILQGSTNESNPEQLPSFWYSLKAQNTSSNRGRGWRSQLQGWRLVIFHSWLNLFLVFVPIAWALDFQEVKTHSLIFAMSILGLVPLVKLHDLCTRDLVIRVGGNKTGLLNASLSNMVEIVVSISALRRCELRVVQAALVGSILSKLLLVLGLCFFAGGMRFSEQGFDATATQMHSSLMSISVGAILLPAAFHFTLEDTGADTAAAQGKYILHMSHGVSIVLLFIYSAYLVFQLWSHKHLYHDKHNKQSRPLPVQVRVGVPKKVNAFKNAGKRVATSASSLDLSRPATRSDPTDNAIPLRQGLYGQPNPSLFDSQVTLNSLSDNSKNVTSDFPEGSTARVVPQPGVPLTHYETYMSNQSSDSTFSEAENPNEDVRQDPVYAYEHNQPTTITPDNEPRLSWAVTIGSMLIVAICVAVTAEALVESMDGISSTIGKEWIGLIVLPSISAVAECITAVNVSVRDELSISVSVAVGSSIQTALFVFPFMVILAWITHKPLSLLLDPFQSLVLYLSVQIVNFVVADGKSNWLEGVILICLYVIIAVSFWFYPGAKLPAALANCAGSIPID